MNVIEQIIKEWSKRIPTGIIDIKNEEHLFTLLEILNEQIGNPKVVSAVIENIREQTRERY